MEDIRKRLDEIIQAEKKGIERQLEEARKKAAEGKQDIDPQMMEKLLKNLEERAGQNKEKPQQAEVIAVGPGTDEVKMEVKKGDQVIYSKYSGTEVKIDEEEFIICKQSDILAVIK